MGTEPFEYTGIHTSTLEFVGICSQEYYQIHKNTQKCTQIRNNFRNKQENSIITRNTVIRNLKNTKEYPLEFTGIYRNTQEFTEINMKEYYRITNNPSEGILRNTQFYCANCKNNYACRVYIGGIGK